MRLGMLVTDNFFSVLGVQPALGGLLTPQETHAPDGDAVVVLSYDFWKNDLAGAPSILNGVVWLNGVAFHVVGVVASSFAGTEPPLQPAFYVPITTAQRLGAAAVNPLEQRDIRTLALKGRLKPGVSLARARAETTILWEALERQSIRTSTATGRWRSGPNWKSAFGRIRRIPRFSRCWRRWRRSSS
jgi:hypothetical protein